MTERIPRMPFILQIDLGDVGADGYIYAFRCDACSIVGTSFDQT